MIDSLSGLCSDISGTSLGVNFIFCMQFTCQVTSGAVEINMTGLYYKAMIGRLRQLSKPRLRQQAGIEQSLTAEHRKIYSCPVGETN